MEVAYLKKGKNHTPNIGLRIIKSSVGVFFCFLIYILRRMHGAPFYSALAVLWCIQSHPKDSVAHALQRTIAPTEDIRILIDKMKNVGITCGLKMLYYPSDDYPGYSYLKLYNGNVRVNNMIDYLKEMYGLETVTTVGVENSRYDIMYHNMDSNQMVRKLGYL